MEIKIQAGSPLRAAARRPVQRWFVGQTIMRQIHVMTTLVTTSIVMT
jgi:hypothetical protein